MIEQNTKVKAELFATFFQYQAGIFQNALMELTEENVLKRPSDRSNHINWILGHILHCRYMLAGRLGLDVESPFGDTYWKAIEDKKYPKMEEVVNDFPKISEKLIQQIKSKSDEELDHRAAQDQPSLADMLSFFSYHEAYHLGQIGYARKIIGLEAMKSH